MTEENPEKFDWRPIAEELHSRALRIRGLAETLADVVGESIAEGDFRDAQTTAWAYEALADVATLLAKELSDRSP